MTGTLVYLEPEELAFSDGGDKYRSVDVADGTGAVA
jgi:hypothetical protein